MSNNQLHDDLLTEVLNQDPSYVAKQQEEEKNFWRLHPLKSIPINTNLKTLFRQIIWIPAVSVVLMIVFSLLFMRQSSQNMSLSTSSQNQITTTNLQDKNTPNDNLNNVTSSNELEKKQTQNTPQNPVETKIKNDQVDITFKYDPNSQSLSYKGTVVGADSCTVLDYASLEKFQTGFNLNYELKRTGEICASVIKEVLVEGVLNTTLDSQQIKYFDNLFEVHKVE